MAILKISGRLGKSLGDNPLENVNRQEDPMNSFFWISVVIKDMNAVIKL